MLHTSSSPSSSPSPSRPAASSPDGKPHLDTRGIIDFLTKQYLAYELDSETRFVTPVARLAIDIGAKFQDGALTAESIENVISELTLKGLMSRAGRMAHYMGETNPAKNVEALKVFAAEKLIFDEAGNKRPFAAFQKAAEHVYYGFVFTAHPTFTMTRELTTALNELSLGDGEAARGKLEAAARIPFETPDLGTENDFAMEAIRHLHSALSRLHEAVLTLARDHYPDEWTSLRPRLVTIASWVGFDLDGRQDILWTSTFGKRIRTQREQLAYYIMAVERIRDTAGHEETSEKADNKDGGEAAARLAGDLLEKLAYTTERLKYYETFFEGYDREQDKDLAALQAISREMNADSDRRIRRARDITAPLEALLANAESPEVQKQCLMLLAKANAMGITSCEIHIRINANQLYNALRRNISLTSHPDDLRYRQAYLEALTEEIDRTEASSVNFGDIMNEQATAPRQFMMMQQIVKHLDADSPIRFLIAEAESAYAVLAALYFARKFGLEAHIDICPLFETSAALERGTKFLESLFEIPAFVSYIEKRGRLCIQTGYSDAGRYIGQSPAGASIERLKERVARLLEERKLTHIGLLFFDTHGESIGRGGHPHDLGARMRYIAPPRFLNLTHQAGLRYTQESSFQGGDGYAYFMTDTSALAVLTRVMSYWFDDFSSVPEDAYYNERASVNSFFNDITMFQEHLMQDSDYGALLSAYGPQMIPGTGSRALKREGAARVQKEELQEARQFRAIPHNAILGQMGMQVNTIGGYGRAIRHNPAFYQEMMHRSPRFQNIVRFAQRGMDISSPMMMKSYIDTLDPETWLVRKNYCADPVLSDAYSHVAKVLKKLNLHTSLKAVFHNIFEDYITIKQTSLALSGETAEKSAPPEERIRLGCLHALRIALIHQIYILASDIPHYSPDHDISRDEILRRIVMLNIPGAVQELKAIFPITAIHKQESDYGEPSTYVSAQEGGYHDEHNRIFAPLLHFHGLIQKISVAIAHHFGFIG